MYDYFEEHSCTTVSENTSTGTIEFHLKVFCILMIVYRLSKFSALGSISQHGTQQQILSNGSSLHMNQPAGTQPDNFQQVSKLIELKCMPKVISDHTKTLKFT